MTVKKIAAAAAIVLFLGVTLGSCASTSGYIADHWPHWAGGMPDGVPPRPGTPGYEEFIAHGQPGKDANTAATDTRPAAVDQKTNVQAAPSSLPPPNRLPPPNSPPPTNSLIVGQGGLY
jgi:hypothetical protein